MFARGTLVLLHFLACYLAKAHGGPIRDTTPFDKYMPSSIGNSSKRCENFYDFVCEHSEQPQDPKYLKKFLEGNAGINKTKAFLLAETYYNSCMNLDKIRNDGRKEILDVMEKLGGYPLLKDNQTAGKQWNFIETLKAIRNSGLTHNGIIDIIIIIVEHNKNDEKSVMKIDAPEINGSTYEDVSNAICFLNSNICHQVTDEINEVINFEQQLIDIINKSNPQTKSIQQMQEHYPFLPWLELINIALPETSTVDQSFGIENISPKFLQSLGDLVRNTSNHILVNHMIWYALKEKLAEIQRISRKEYVDAERWKECAAYTKAALPVAVGALYVQGDFNAESRKYIENMFVSIRDSVAQKLNGLNWLSNDTKSPNIERIRSITYTIGNKTLTGQRVEEFYNGLDLNANNWFSNEEKVAQFKLKRIFNELKNKTWYSKFLLKKGSSYCSDENSIVLTGDDLYLDQDLLSRPNYTNYGMIGRLIGHEISHAINKMNRNTTNITDEEAIIKQNNCIAEHYSIYNGGHPTYGTQHEDIADIIGLKAAYDAFSGLKGDSLCDIGDSLCDISRKRLFWIASAQRMCTKYGNSGYSPESVHSPNRFRVLGPLRNIGNFSEDFNCTSGEYMNPSEKCKW